MTDCPVISVDGGTTLQRHWLNINHVPAKLSNLNFHPLEDVSRYRDPQLQVGEIVEFGTQNLQILMFKHLFHSQ